MSDDETTSEEIELTIDETFKVYDTFDSVSFDVDDSEVEIVDVDKVDFIPHDEIEDVCAVLLDKRNFKPKRGAKYDVQSPLKRKREDDVEVAPKKKKRTIGESIKELLKKTEESVKMVTSISKLRKKRKVVNKLPSQRIAFSSCNESTIDTLFNLVTYIGDAQIDDDITDTTTTLILGQNNRSLKVLHAMSLGLFIVSPRWIRICMDQGKWIDPERYEVTNWFPGIASSRISKNDEGRLFKGKKFYVKDNINIPMKDFIKILESIGGTTVKSPKDSEIIISNSKLNKSYQIDIVSPQWLLDSLTNWSILPTSTYLVK